MFKIVRDIRTHDTMWLSSRPPRCRAGHTQGRRQQWCRRSRRSPQWTRKSRSRRCKRPDMAQGPPAREPWGGPRPGQNLGTRALGLGENVLGARVRQWGPLAGRRHAGQGPKHGIGTEA